MTKDEAPDYFFCERTLINSLEDTNVSQKIEDSHRFALAITGHYQQAFNLTGDLNAKLCAVIGYDRAIRFQQKQQEKQHD